MLAFGSKRIWGEPCWSHTVVELFACQWFLDWMCENLVLNFASKTKLPLSNSEMSVSNPFRLFLRKLDRHRFLCCWQIVRPFYICRAYRKKIYMSKLHSVLSCRELVVCFRNHLPFLVTMLRANEHFLKRKILLRSVHSQIGPFLGDSIDFCVSCCAWSWRKKSAHSWYGKTLLTFCWHTRNVEQSAVHDFY